MKKQNKILILFLAILLGGLILSKPIFGLFRNTDTIANKIGCRLFEFNKITVVVNNGMELDDIEIKIGNSIVFMAGKQVNRIGQEYGHTVFDIYHKELLIAEIGHWKRNNWYTNDYNIEILEKSNDFIVKHLISGPDSKNDNFQKRYVYKNKNTLIRVDYLTENGEVYNSEEKGGNTVYSK